ncbi:50S ribosomal protein L4 [Faecalibacillus faecis]|uniref:50S ribosomal protein L4 n=1 Tax=Faecalibacillus faecis TaxID=1982628 RepID=UPI00386D38BC
MAAKKINLKVLNQAGEETGKVSVSAEVFGVEVNEQVMFDAVQVYQANMRQATAKTLTRAEVSGGGKKPWRQKGTGRARAGSSRSPVWRHGGIVFGPTGNQNYKLSMNKKAHALAVKSALTLKANDKDIIVVDNLDLAEVKTKAVVEMLTKLNAKKKTLVVLDKENDSFVLSARNLPGVIVTTTNNLSVYDIMNTDSLLFTSDSIKVVEGGLK